MARYWTKSRQRRGQRSSHRYRHLGYFKCSSLGNLKLGKWMRLMTLWDLILFSCLSMPLGGATAGAITLHSGWGSYGVAIIVGSIVGGIGAWSFRLGSYTLVPQSRTTPYTKWETGIIYCIYIGGMAWSLILSWVGFCLAHTLGALL